MHLSLGAHSEGRKQQRRCPTFRLLLKRRRRRGIGHATTSVEDDAWIIQEAGHANNSAGIPICSATVPAAARRRLSIPTPKLSHPPPPPLLFAMQIGFPSGLCQKTGRWEGGLQRRQRRKSSVLKYSVFKYSDSVSRIISKLRILFTEYEVSCTKKKRTKKEYFCQKKYLMVK